MGQKEKNCQLDAENAFEKQVFAFMALVWNRQQLVTFRVLTSSFISLVKENGSPVQCFYISLINTANKDSFKYLGMVLYRTHIAKSAKHILDPFLAGCHKIWQLVREDY